MVTQALARPKSNQNGSGVVTPANENKDACLSPRASGVSPSKEAPLAPPPVLCVLDPGSDLEPGTAAGVRTHAPQE